MMVKKKLNKKVIKKTIEKKFAREQLKRKIIDLSWGLVKNLTDLVLLQLFLASSLTFKGRYAQKDIKELFEGTQEIDWEKIRKTLTQFKKEGIVSYTRSKILEPQITDLGIKRLKRIMPSYDLKRPWDKKVYLITYDIAEEQRRGRDLLRDFLENIGCGKLQESVWLTPYNYQKLITTFIDQNNIEGSIIISTIGKDGSIGEENLRELLKKVYKLEELNERYEEFLIKVKQESIDNLNIGFAYLSILKDDSQLPFELLPDGWLGEKAYFVYQRIIKVQKLTNTSKRLDFTHGRE